MIPSLDPSGQQFLNQLNRISQRMETAQRRIATGLKLSRASDDPDRIPALLQARAELAAASQIQANLSRIKAEVDAGEHALQTAVQLLERARTLAAQGATGTQTAESRAALGAEIGSILEQLVGLAATQVESRFIFSGDADQTIPYTVDLTQSPPLSGYLGSPATRLAQHPNGTTFALGRTAQEIFDSTAPETNVFATLVSLRDALLANDEDAVRASLDGLESAGDHLNLQLAYYGTAQNKIAEANEYAENARVRLQTLIAETEEADLSEAILELNQAQIQHQAALAARANLPRRTLFDYIG